ncbi:hypothetical protein D3C75_696430 [compost metagenome]
MPSSRTAWWPRAVVARWLSAWALARTSWLPTSWRCVRLLTASCTWKKATSLKSAVIRSLSGTSRATRSSAKPCNITKVPRLPTRALTATSCSRKSTSSQALFSARLKAAWARTTCWSKPLARKLPTCLPRCATCRSLPAAPATTPVWLRVTGWKAWPASLARWKWPASSVTARWWCSRTLCSSPSRSPAKPPIPWPHCETPRSWVSSAAWRSATWVSARWYASRT